MKRETLAEGERHTPVSVNLAHTGFVVEFGKVVGQIGIFGFEAGTSGGEIPVILAIVFGARSVAEVVVIVQRL